MPRTRHRRTLTRIVSGAVEQRDREVRTRDRATPVDHHQYQANSKDRLRDTIRRSLYEGKAQSRRRTFAICTEA